MAQMLLRVMLQVNRWHKRYSESCYRLIDGTNVTTSDEHMWLVPLTEGENHWLTVTFAEATEMTGLRLWNYNKSPEDTYRGVSIRQRDILLQRSE